MSLVSGELRHFRERFRELDHPTDRPMLDPWRHLLELGRSRAGPPEESLTTRPHSLRGELECLVESFRGAGSESVEPSPVFFESLESRKDDFDAAKLQRFDHLAKEQGLLPPALDQQP